MLLMIFFFFTRIKVYIYLKSPQPYNYTLVFSRILHFSRMHFSRILMNHVMNRLDISLSIINILKATWMITLNPTDSLFINTSHF